MAYIPAMNDLQLARNLGQMFETATRSIRSQLDNSNMALPPSVTSFINTNYYNIETTFTTGEIVKGLDSNNDNEVYTVLKHLVGKLVTRNEFQGDPAIGGSVDGEANNETVREIVQLFPHIIKNVNSTNLKIKRLVYIILLRFNYLQPDISLLSINAIQKSLTDKTSINRSLAIRCLSGIQIPAILPILLLSMGKLVKDSSPLVRSACAISIIKCVELDMHNNSITGNSTQKKKKSLVYSNNAKSEREYLIHSLKDDTSAIYQLSNHLELLLSDNDPKVLSCAIVTYHEVFNGCYDLIHNKILNLISHIEDLDSFAICSTLDILCDYIKLFYADFDNLKSAPNELQELFEHLTNILKYDMNHNVILSIVKILINVYPFEIGGVRLNKIMIRLIQKDEFSDINEDSKISIALDTIIYLLNNELVNFTNYEISNFFPLFDDNNNIFSSKIDILFKIINEGNFDIIFRELKFLIDNSNYNYFFKYEILKNINKLIVLKILTIEQFSCIIRFFMNKLQTEKNDLLVGEYITGLRQLIQSNLGYYNEILIKLVGRLIESYTERRQIMSNAKSSIIWLLGEFSINYDNFKLDGENERNVEVLKSILPDLSLILVKNFKTEQSYHVRLAILGFLTKLLISDIVEHGKENYDILNNTLFKCFNYVLQLCKYDAELDIRDMSRMVGSLLPNIVYFADISINQDIDIDEMLQNDSVLMNHCREKCAQINLAVLMFELNKPEIRDVSRLASDDGGAINTGMAAVSKYNRVTKSRLDPGYLSYYQELRSEGFELRDYARYNSSLGSTNVKTFVRSTSLEPKSQPSGNSSPATSHSKKYQLQSLEDFLS